MATVWGRPFPVSAWQCPSAQHKIGVEEHDWTAQSPDLNPIEHLWDELESRLRARPNRPPSVPDLTNALVTESKQVPSFSGKTSQKSGGGCYSSKGGTNSILMPMILEWDVWQAGTFWPCSVCIHSAIHSTILFYSAQIIMYCTALHNLLNFHAYDWMLMFFYTMLIIWFVTVLSMMDIKWVRSLPALTVSIYISIDQ